ncbi:hypothetical protein AABH71_001348 [Salmonella enterica]|uniref:hypothetical protein n=1 Tax=Salmonella enterica TaxID=28901 RepID=UPI0012F44986|nr:hypothetical protein [Salmonella enterica subsp. enterica serovar Dahomey]EAW9078026.1 hypothetical protein [Salmonella enterica]EBQ9004828.1 hypothetical protein [Salmonella enterica subsp. enterica serovar Blockley]ECW2122565.1 hypothetical protein [Salmonella enterica]
MKYAEHPGNNSGKVNIRRRYLPGLSAISGLALLLSVGFSGSAGALTFSFDYTYVILANTCTVESIGADSDGPVSGTGAAFTVSWGNVTRSQLLSPPVEIHKTFGLRMNCGGDIWQPKVEITGVSSSSFITFAAPPYGALAGFRIEKSAHDTSGAGGDILSRVTSLPEHTSGNSREILLEAWPALLPGKDITKLQSGTPITGTVTIHVSYN